MASLITTQGIICRVVRYGETSLITDIYSPDLGLQSYIINGVRTNKSKTGAGILQVMNIVHFVAYHTPTNSKLSRLKEIQLAHVYQRLTSDVARSAIAMLLIEICRYVLRVSDDNESVFAFIKERLISLDIQTTGIGHFHILFLIDLAPLLGFGIHQNYSLQEPYFDLREGGFSPLPSERRYAMNLDASALLSRFLANDYPPTSRIQRRLLLDKLIDFYRYHIPGFGELKSLAVLHSLYDE